MKLKPILAAALFVAAFIATAPSAHAQATRTWVSGVGSDANPGSRTAPDKTFAGAYSLTADGGEIDALDPGGFGAITLSKAMTLDGCASHAGVLVSGTPGIVIDDTTPGDTIILRRLDIDGVSGIGAGFGGTTGVSIIAASNVVIEDCDIYGFTQYAVKVAPSANCNVVIKDCTFTNLGIGGVINAGTAGSVSISIRHTEISGTPIGIEASFGVTQVSDSEITNCSTYGLDSETGGTLTAEDCMVTNGATAVFADTNSKVRLADNDFLDNSVAGFAGPGTISTGGGNKKSNNGSIAGVPNATMVVQ
jgi:hypothetical protein